MATARPFLLLNQEIPELMYIFKIVLSFIPFFISVENSDWRLRKDENGIAVYTRTVDSSSFEEFKAIAVINDVSLVQVLDILLDVENYTSLIPDCIESRVLFRRGKYYDIHYIRMDSPWPVKDRDAIYQSETTVSDSWKHAYISLSPIGNYIDEKNELVRMYKGSGFWEIEELPGNAIKIIYQFQSDPGGKIPGWLANSVIISNPYKTLENLKRLLTPTKK
jgi:hypothetical protein